MLAREAELAEMITDRGAEIAKLRKSDWPPRQRNRRLPKQQLKNKNVQRAEREAAVAALTNQRAEHSSATNEMESDLRGVETR